MMGESVKIRHTTTLETMECITCGTPFAIAKSLHDHCLEQGGFWCCPAGHSQGWAEGQKAIKDKDLQRRLDRSIKQKDSAIKQKEWAEQEAKNQKKSAAAYKGQVTKLKRRSAAGTCPCCSRTFKQLRAHMNNMHPKYVDDALIKAKK